jgi:hypothetical protein
MRARTTTVCRKPCRARINSVAHAACERARFPSDGFFLPRESGEGGPPEGWWKGRRTQQHSLDDSGAKSQTPLPPRKSAVPLPRLHGEDVAKRRSPHERKRHAGTMVKLHDLSRISLRSSGLHSQKKKKEAERRQTQCFMFRTSGCGRATRVPACADPPLRARSPVGVPPRFLPEGDLLPKALLQARLPGTWS